MTRPTQAPAGAAQPDAGAPDTPADLSKRSWWRIFKRTVKEFQDDSLIDWAAALTYYGILALFPGMIVLVALLGLVGQYPETFDALLDILRQVAPASAVDTIARPLEEVIRSKGSAGALLGFGLLVAIWSASRYIGAFMRAANVVYEVEEGRPFWKLAPLQIVLTILMLALLAVVLIALVLTGPLAEAVGNVVGLGGLAVTVWSIAKWPVLVVIVMGMFAVLYWVAPNVQQPHIKWITPGGVFAVVVWIVASLLFGLYVANFGSYNKTYGTLGGAITFLVWLWVSNMALLLGAELDAEIERERELRAGLPAEEEIQLPPRQAPQGGRA